jgi:tRNA-Thr(GGU) m(6)t(6)A37 methyltransferase TsaA
LKKENKTKHSEDIRMEPIGVIRTPYKEPVDIPIQGVFRNEVGGIVELKQEFVAGLKDLDGFSHAILIYHFHRSGQVRLDGKPFLEDVTHGVFAIRSPHRPNHIGLSIVKIERIEDNLIHFKEVDMLDGTPLLDIKPYVSHFDAREDIRCGWLDKHFESGAIPSKTILKE